MFPLQSFPLSACGREVRGEGEHAVSFPVAHTHLGVCPDPAVRGIVRLSAVLEVRNLQLG